MLVEIGGGVFKLKLILFLILRQLSDYLTGIVFNIRYILYFNFIIESYNKFLLHLLNICFNNLLLSSPPSFFDVINMIGFSTL